MDFNNNPYSSLYFDILSTINDMLTRLIIQVVTRRPLIHKIETHFLSSYKRMCKSHWMCRHHKIKRHRKIIPLDFTAVHIRSSHFIATVKKKLKRSEDIFKKGCDIFTSEISYNKLDEYVTEFIKCEEQNNNDLKSSNCKMMMMET